MRALVEVTREIEKARPFDTFFASWTGTYSLHSSSFHVLVTLISLLPTMTIHPIHLNIVRNFIRWMALLHQRISIQLVAKVSELTVRQCFRPDVSDHLLCPAIDWLDLMILYLVPCCQDAPVHMLRLLG